VGCLLTSALSNSPSSSAGGWFANGGRIVYASSPSYLLRSHVPSQDRHPLTDQAHRRGRRRQDIILYSTYLADHRSCYVRVYGDGAYRGFPAESDSQGMDTLLFRKISISEDRVADDMPT